LSIKVSIQLALLVFLTKLCFAQYNTIVVPHEYDSISGQQRSVISGWTFYPSDNDSLTLLYGTYDSDNTVGCGVIGYNQQFQHNSHNVNFINSLGKEPSYFIYDKLNNCYYVRQILLSKDTLNPWRVRIRFLKTDSAFNILKQIELGDSNEVLDPFDFVQYNGNIYFTARHIVGHKWADSFRVFVAKFDSELNAMWIQDFQHGTKESPVNLVGIGSQMHISCYNLAGPGSDDIEYTFVKHLDTSTGAVVSIDSMPYVEDQSRALMSSITASNGVEKLVLVTDTDEIGGSYYSAIRYQVLNLAGTLEVDSVIYAGESRVITYGIRKISNSRFLVLGEREIVPGNGFWMFASAMLVDTKPSVVWQHCYNHMDSALWILNDGLQRSDGSYLLCGFAHGSAADKFAYIIHVDSLGCYDPNLCYPAAVNPQHDLASTFSIFPNPAFHHLTVEGQNTVSQIAVYNMQGDIVYQSQPNTLQHQILCYTWPSGMYYVKVTIDGRVLVRPFLKQ
jgi:hypothetical protein